MILAGDVGGTKVHLALYDFINGKLEYTRDERYPAKNYSGLEEIVKEFLGADKVTAACFGVPGPVRNGRLRLTNLPWTLDSYELCAGLGVDHVFLINDLEANGYGNCRTHQRADLHSERRRRRPDRKSYADCRRDGPGRMFPCVERQHAHSQPLRGRPRGLRSAK